jgi:monofunctional biosynthetic peptidoglycan transglycosylase
MMGSEVSFPNYAGGISMEAVFRTKRYNKRLHFWFVFYIIFLVLRTSNVYSEQVKDLSQKSLLDFNSPIAVKEWRIVNDGVMGGLSKSQMIITERSTAIFQGYISLKNNGGFASIRTVPKAYELSNYDGLTLRIKGDGKKYQVRLRTDDKFDGISYKESFKTIPDKWITVTLYFKIFVPSYHGRVVTDAPILTPKKIRQIGFLIADKQAGPFHLEIDWVRAQKEVEDIYK